MKQRKYVIIFVMAIFMLGCLGGVIIFKSSDSKEKETVPDFVLCYGEVNAEGHIMSDIANYFAKEVKRLSKGKVLVEIYPSGQLGDDARCYQALKMGALDLYRGNSASLALDETPQIAAMTLPYIFDDRNHFWKVCNSTLGEEILNNVHECYEDVRALAFMDEGARNFITVNKPIRTIEDIKGLQIRGLKSNIMIDTLEALGANVVQMEYVELYSALDRKLVDGAENPPISYYYNKFYEVAPYCVKDMHTYAPGVILISEITWEKLGEEYQKVIMEAAKLAQDYNMLKIAEVEEAVCREMKENGTIITEVSDLEKWQLAVEPIYQKYGTRFADIIAEIKEMR